MQKTNELPSRRTIYTVAAVIVVLAIGLAAVTHADERGKRPDKPERPEKSEVRGALVNIAAKLNLMQDFRLVVNDDSETRVRGATVAATSSSGFTATTATPPLTFIVQTDASTKFNQKGAGTGSLADIAVGDTVNFRGTVLSGTTTSTWTVKATHVEDKTHRVKPPKPPKPPKPATTTAHVTATATAQMQINALLNVIERLQALVNQWKIQFGL